MKALAPLVRDAIGALPGTFTTRDVFAALPHIEKGYLSNTLSDMVKVGSLRHDGFTDITIALARGPSGAKRRVAVRRFAKVDAIGATRSSVGWITGAAELERCMRAWPRGDAIGGDA